MTTPDDRAVAQEVMNMLLPCEQTIDRARVYALVAAGVKRGRLEMIDHADAVLAYLRGTPQARTRDVARDVFYAVGDYGFRSWESVGAPRTKERNDAIRTLAALHGAGYVARGGAGTAADPYTWSLPE